MNVPARYVIGLLLHFALPCGTSQLLTRIVTERLWWGLARTVRVDNR